MSIYEPPHRLAVVAEFAAAQAGYPVLAFTQGIWNGA